MPLVNPPSPGSRAVVVAQPLRSSPLEEVGPWVARVGPSGASTIPKIITPGLALHELGSFPATNIHLHRSVLPRLSRSSSVTERNGTYSRGSGSFPSRRVRVRSRVVIRHFAKYMYLSGRREKKKAISCCAGMQASLPRARPLWPAAINPMAGISPGRRGFLGNAKVAQAGDSDWQGGSEESRLHVPNIILVLSGQVPYNSRGVYGL
ncbi:hypothetical protein L209DRAFT_133946 [Thermothelomyces heterothallicus CBS 203.75]